VVIVQKCTFLSHLSVTQLSAVTNALKQRRPYVVKGLSVCFIQSRFPEKVIIAYHIFVSVSSL